MDFDEEEFDEDEYFFVICCGVVVIVMLMIIEIIHHIRFTKNSIACVLSITCDLGRNKYIHNIIFGGTTNQVDYLKMQSNAFFNFATLIRDAGLLKDTIHFLNEKQLLTSPYITRYKLKQIKDIKNQINPYID